MLTTDAEPVPTGLADINRRPSAIGEEPTHTVGELGSTVHLHPAESPRARLPLPLPATLTARDALPEALLYGHRMAPSGL
jgi:hypothetical protein